MCFCRWDCFDFWVMSRLTKWKLEKAKVKVVFRLQFHATHVSQLTNNLIRRSLVYPHIITHLASSSFKYSSLLPIVVALCSNAVGVELREFLSSSIRCWWCVLAECFVYIIKGSTSGMGQTIHIVYSRWLCKSYIENNESTCEKWNLQVGGSDLWNYKAASGYKD